MTSSATQTEREHPFMSGAAILNALADGALIVDIDGYVRQINPAAARLLAVEPEAVLDQTVDRLPRGAVLRQFDELRPGVIEVGDCTIGFQKRPLLADDHLSDVLGTLIILRDLTAELAEQRRRYDYFCRALHDVRVPLQAISGAAEGLMRGWFGPLTDEQREFAGLIKENANHQGELFNQLYNAYSLSTHITKLDAERISIDTMIHEVEQEFAPRFAARQQSFEVELPADLPLIFVDRRRLRQLLAALLGNANRYTYPGGAVALRVQHSGDDIVVEVQDTGVGIRAEDQPKIFTPFFRGDNPLKEGRYGGLNLSIAKQLAELHGGRMWFTSVEAEGSTFAFTLPVV
jgi:signal transduction histidine kinase